MRAVLQILRRNYRTFLLMTVGILLCNILTGNRACDATAAIRPEQYCDSALIHFHVARTELDMDLSGNRASLQRMTDSLNVYASRDSLYQLKSIRVVGAASPEGSIPFNAWLSENRAKRIHNYFANTIAMPDSVTEFLFIGRDWYGLRRLVEKDENVPERDQLLGLLDSYLDSNSLSDSRSDRLLKEIKLLNDGKTYQYILKELFPTLRASRLYVTYERTPDKPLPLLDDVLLYPEVEIEDFNQLSSIPEFEQPEVFKVCKPFYMDLRTNMLLDVLAIPNIGAEFYIGKNFSVGANWAYGWWDSNRRHRYWRAYGGDLNARWWFGQAAERKPLTGHHVGIYGGVLTFDFEWGGTGYMGGRPGHDLWDRCLMNVGIEYGYSLPISRRLNLDFTIGFGYVNGLVEKYRPVADFYFWESTTRKTWIGPSKAEISLIWLIGCGNFNVRKGGGR